MDPFLILYLTLVGHRNARNEEQTMDFSKLISAATQIVPILIYCGFLIFFVRIIKKKEKEIRSLSEQLKIFSVENVSLKIQIGHNLDLIKAYELKVQEMDIDYQTISEKLKDAEDKLESLSTKTSKSSWGGISPKGWGKEV